MWLANALTLARIPLAGAFWATYGDRTWSLAILGLAGVSDALDGTLARRARARRPSASTAGEWLDPLADKIFVVAVLGAAAHHGTTAWSTVAMVCTRELVLVPLALAHRMFGRRVPHAYQADRLGKATTIAQLAAAAAIVTRLPIASALAIVAGGLGLTAAAHYVARSLHRARLAT
jgi:cardiolipin synthase